jgi:DNA-directed RNA polymerase specialized sigma24 family protein
LETAQVLGLSLGAVQQRLFRARGALKRVLDRQHTPASAKAYATR